MTFVAALDQQWPYVLLEVLDLLAPEGRWLDIGGPG
jgi:hypothetical protein